MADSVPILIYMLHIHSNILPQFSKDQVLPIKKTIQNSFNLFKTNIFPTQFKGPGEYSKTTISWLLDLFLSGFE